MFRHSWPLKPPAMYTLSGGGGGVREGGVREGGGVKERKGEVKKGGWSEEKVLIRKVEREG